MLIDDKIYRTNGFRILGLDITSSNTRIDNLIAQIDFYRETKDFKDYEPLKGAFNASEMDLLLPVRPEPSYNEYQNAKNRLFDVESRLIDEIFWFWPKTFDNQLDEEVVKYLRDKKYSKAIRYWDDKSNTNSINMTSIHNLAVLYHVRALDGFAEGKGNKQLFSDLELSLNYWSLIVNSNSFKDFVKERVNSINDPRLNDEFVDKIFNDLPENLLNINYIYIKKYLNSEKLGKRKQNYIHKYIENIKNSPFDKALISRFSSKIIDAIDKRIKEDKDSIEKTLESESNQEKRYDLILKYYENVLPYLEILYVSFNNDIISSTLLNDTSKFIYYKIPTASRISNVKGYNEPKYNKYMEILECLDEYSTSKKLSKEIDSDLTYLRPSQPIEYAINIDVVDDGGDALSDVMVTFTNLDTEKSFNITTDSTGNCKISDLPKGKYSYKIEKKGYNSNDGTKKVHEDSYLKIKLKKEKSSAGHVFKINTIDEKGDVLNDVKVTLINLDTDKSYITFSDSTGNSKISNLPEGMYTYQAEKEGYESDYGTRNLKLYSNLKIRLKKEKPAVKKYSVNIYVSDENKDALNDVKLTLTNSDTNQSYNITTDSSGNCKIDDLEQGMYTYETQKSGYNSDNGRINVDKDSDFKISIKKAKSPISTSTEISESSNYKQYYILVAAIILASLVYYSVTNFL